MSYYEDLDGPEPCCGCGRAPMYPRLEWPAHPAHGVPVCPACLAFRRNPSLCLQELADATPKGPPPLTDYERAGRARGYTRVDVYDTKTKTRTAK